MSHGLASAVCAFFLLASAATAASGGQRSTTLAVSATVVRSCAVAPSASGIAVTCSKGVPRIAVGSSPRPDLLRPSPAHALLVPPDQAQPDTTLVTINF